ncbi:relaxase/mobilization nuclease domain-containing protein, partial [Clostridioides difficile]|uniref:relaxase/mobilization nuclease domain-containing protein n=1 Tax=Clostridioides difficile TaxID=1496 RepID=UPI0021D0474B
VSTHKCHQETAHTQFLRTRNDAGANGTVLARHLIQSFLPGEASPEMAHQIGMELCKKILKDEYEFVLSTHIDKGHIHNHIIFNNVNMVTGKCYHSNKKSYHQIRYQSDKLCKENNLSVIDKFYESYKRKYKTNGKSWYENEQSKKGTSWKSRLQFDIDRLIKQSKDWEEFLKKMAELGYEIKHGKHIAFKPKDKQRFT